MTSAEGTKNYIEELYKKGYISKEQRDQNIKDFSKINLMEIYYQNRSQRNNMKIQKSLVSSIKQSIIDQKLLWVLLELLILLIIKKK